jgi:glycylpeptide N-tetradecanoyltransferase
LKIMDVVKGKAGLGGHNKKDMGTHKVRGGSSLIFTALISAVLGNTTSSATRSGQHSQGDSLLTFELTGEGPPLDDGYIEASKPREEVRQEPYPLPKDFEWSTLDINDPKQARYLTST